VVLTASAETLPEPELATKAKLAVGPAGIIGLFAMLPPHPFTMSKRARMTAKVKDRMSSFTE
jgi:hypothetical protein